MATSNITITQDDCVNLYVRPGRAGDPVRTWTAELGPVYPGLVIRCNDNECLDSETLQPLDDFLGFPYRIEVYPASGQAMAEESFIEGIARVMQALAASGCDVQAATQYESQLPGGGRLRPSAMK